MSLLFPGDILLPYAMVGLALIPIARLRSRALISLGVAALLAPVLGQAFVILWDIDLGKPFRDVGAKILVGLASEPLRGMDWVDFLRRLDGWNYLAWSLSGPAYRFALLLVTWRFFKLLGVMCIGIWIGREILKGCLDHPRTLARVLVYGAAFGVPGSVIYASGGGLWSARVWEGWITHVWYAVSVAPLGLAYAAAFALLWQTRARALLRCFSFAGRLSLTNYLLQSLVCVFLFYGVGFGAAGSFGPLGLLGVAIAVFVCQALLSWWWLRFARLGPAEWLWRAAIHGKRPRFLRAR
ncbi:MAG: DUF418 domain-containing protein [Myxococcota bacterium]